MNLLSAVAVGAGAALGALLRWWLGALLNPVFPTVPLGTLAANWLGGFIMGIAMGLIANYQALSPEIRLFVTTGFLGGLTTFSTFSAETVTLFLRTQYGWAFTTILVHVAGSLAMTLLGFYSYRLLRL
ncbi:MAG: fluoride efflux transporter CrcB [Stenotrophobium sp.]